MATSSNAANAVQKIQKAFVVYVKPDGSVSNFPTPEATAVRTEFSNGVKRDLLLSSMNDDMKANASLQGFAIRTQRSYQALKAIDEVIEAYDDTVADLENGVWIESKAGEPKVTMLANAIIMSLEANGQTVDDTRKRSIIEKLKDAEYREKANANEHVQANLANLKLEAAKKRAKEAKAAAAEAGTEATEGLSDF